MSKIKTEILSNICYTELVYGRINKKLKTNDTKISIERKLFDIIKKTDEVHFKKQGKNFYITNKEENITITVNSYTYRVITVDLANIYQLKNKR